MTFVARYKFKIINSLLLALTLIFVLFSSSRLEAAQFNFPQVVADSNPLQILGPAGDRLTFIKTGATTCGSYVMAEILVPPGEGPLPHIHHYTDEWFYFPQGGMTLEMGNNAFPHINIVPGVNAPKERLHLVKTKAGSLYYGARYYVHGFVNKTNKPIKFISIWTPDDSKVGMTSFFKAVGQPILDPANPPQIDPQNKALFVSEAPKYGINISSDFWQYVSAVDYKKLPPMDNHAKELLAILAPDLKGSHIKARTSCK